VNARQARRAKALDALVDTVALEHFHEAHGNPELPPVAVVIAAYKERDNIGKVMSSLPKQICGLDAAAIVVVDGEEDGTAEIVRAAGQYACVAAPATWSPPTATARPTPTTSVSSLHPSSTARPTS
jgi:cellulose synthase/poly-beta-1,6-N-acetylglucosamine synthase-like glycosyltransferase